MLILYIKYFLCGEMPVCGVCHGCPMGLARQTLWCLTINKGTIKSSGTSTCRRIVLEMITYQKAIICTFFVLQVSKEASILINTKRLIKHFIRVASTSFYIQATMAYWPPGLCGSRVLCQTGQVQDKPPKSRSPKKSFICHYMFFSYCENEISKLHCWQGYF